MNFPRYMFLNAKPSLYGNRRGIKLAFPVTRSRNVPYSFTEVGVIVICLLRCQSLQTPLPPTATPVICWIHGLVNVICCFPADTSAGTRVFTAETGSACCSEAFSFNALPDRSSITSLLRFILLLLLRRSSLWVLYNWSPNIEQCCDTVTL